MGIQTVRHDRNNYWKLVMLLSSQYLQLSVSWEEVIFGPEK